MNVHKMDAKEMIIYWYERHWEAGFVKWWKGYETLALHDGYHEKGARSFEEALLNMNDFVGRLLQIEDKKAIILDAGCGIGGTSIYLGNKYPKAKFIGITLSKKQVKLARKFADERNFNKNTEFYLMDYMETSFPSNYFDGVFALESISYAPNKKDFIKEMHRILKPGGRIIIIGPAIKKRLNDFMKKVHLWYNIGRGNPYSFPVLNDLIEYLKGYFSNVIVRDISRNIVWSEARATLIAIPYVVIITLKKFFSKNYKIWKDPHFYLAVAILTPIMAISGTAGYYAITADKE
ncbi:MAG: methyltransferase domain-containing protein [Thermoplasmata archaeon]|nr:methyltransferase domain-containing protein [Thermoplasmata archaeon]